MQYWTPRCSAELPSASGRKGATTPSIGLFGRLSASFDTRDRSTWRTADGAWTGELRRSRNGRHVYLALFHDGTYLGRYDVTGWHAASTRSRVRQPRSNTAPAAAGGLSAHGRAAPAIRSPGRPDCLQRRRDEPVARPTTTCGRWVVSIRWRPDRRTSPRPCLAVADYGLHSAVKTAVACARAGVEHIAGLRVRVVAERSFRAWSEQPRELILLAIDDVGWTNIVQLSNLGQLCGGDWRGPRVDWRDLAEHAEGLVCLAGGPPGLGLLACYVERAENPDEPAEALSSSRAAWPRSTTIGCI